MTIQIGLLAEASLAKRTLEWFLLVMDISDVTLKVTGDAEAPLAVLAFVWLLAGVRPQVSRQVRRSRKDLAAKFAGISVLRLETGLHADRIRWQI